MLKLVLLLALLVGGVKLFRSGAHTGRLATSIAGGAALVLAFMLAGPAIAHASGGGVDWLAPRPWGRELINDPTFGPIVGLVCIALIILA